MWKKSINQASRTSANAQGARLQFKSVENTTITTTHPRSIVLLGQFFTSLAAPPTPTPIPALYMESSYEKSETPQDSEKGLSHGRHELPTLFDYVSRPCFAAR